MIGGVDYPKYPVGTFTADDQNDYGAVVTGQVFIPANGDYTFVDLVDDFTMFAVDLNGDGELESVDSLGDADVVTGEFGGFDEIAILDDDWVNADGGGGNGQGNNVSEVTFEGVTGDGDWRDFEMWMSEGGGGDRGMMVMAPSADISGNVPLTQEELDNFVLKPDQIQTLYEPIISGKSLATLSPDADFVLQVGAGGNDQIVVDDLDGVLETTLDVSGATVTVEDAGDLEAGAEVQIFVADSVTGTGDLILNLADPSAWDLSKLDLGILIFGAGGCNPNSQGDLDGNGVVDFADFLVLSGNFGNAVASHTEGDIDCNGTVDFSDFLALSGNFGNAVGGAQSVPEPSSMMLFVLSGLGIGWLRRRRS